MILEHSTPPDTGGTLLERARAGNGEALASLYRHHATPLFNLALRLIGNRSDAEDVLHDVFLGLPEALSNYEERGALGSWLKRITARVALNRLRSMRRRAEEETDADLSQRGSKGNALDAIAVREAVGSLPQALRTVFVLKEVEGFTHEEIGGLLGITRGASEVRLHRAIKALRATLETRT